MSSLKQIEANRRNAVKSTGPITPEGKERSRGNAFRHGLTSETVIAGLEDQEDYQAFEAAVIADYDAETAVERELVLRFPDRTFTGWTAPASPGAPLRLHCEGLSPFTPCRSPGAHWLRFVKSRMADRRGGVDKCSFW
jgi:hypothetical protein